MRKRDVPCKEEGRTRREVAQGAWREGRRATREERRWAYGGASRGGGTSAGQGSGAAAWGGGAAVRVWVRRSGDVGRNIWRGAGIRSSGVGRRSGGACGGEVERR